MTYRVGRREGIVCMSKLRGFNNLILLSLCFKIEAY